VRLVTNTPGINISAAARTFGLCVSTAHAILRRSEAPESVLVSRRGGARSVKVTPAALAALSGWLDERPDLTLSQLRDRLMDELSIIVSTKSISNALDRIGFTTKLLRSLPISRNCPETVQARREYAQRFFSDAPPDHRNIIWVDECGFNLHLRRRFGRFGRARRGQRATIEVPNSRGHNISVCAAMSEEGFLHEHLFPGAYNTERFCVFLQELFDLMHQRGRSGCWIIIDNVRFHHAADVKACAIGRGHILVFLPPYSPMLNPIESLFGKWKALIRTQGVTFNQVSLLMSMAAARYEITRTDCLGWIRDINRNIGLSMQNHLFE
jgi:transposase